VQALAHFVVRYADADVVRDLPHAIVAERLKSAVMIAHRCGARLQRVFAELHCNDRTTMLAAPPRRGRGAFG
jgi:hypothetical protein